MRQPAILCLLLLAFGACDGADELGPDGGGGGPDGSVPDGRDPDGSPPVDCPTWETCGSTSTCGVIYRDGCEPVACGLCRYESRDVDTAGEQASMFGGSPSHIAYVRTQGARQVRAVTFSNGTSWDNELVAPVLAPGATQGTAVIRTSTAQEGTTWVVWSEADGAIHAASKPYVIVPPQPWTIHRDIAVGTQPKLARLTDGTIVLAYLAPGGIHVRQFAGTVWSAPTVITADVSAFALATAWDGFENILVAWRTPAQDVWSARSRNAMPYTTAAIETGLAPNPDGASIAILGGQGTVTVVYGRDPDTTVYATRRVDGTWDKVELGRFHGQGGGVGLAGTSSGQVAYTSAVGVHVGDLISTAPAVFAEQVVSNRCGRGRLVATASGGVTPMLLHTCGDGSISWTWHAAQRFPDGWNARCLAVAGELGDTARSCASDPPSPAACVIAGTRRFCGVAGEVTDLAYAQVCGDAAVDPAILGPCETAAAAVACVPDGTDGTAEVPAACLP